MKITTQLQELRKNLTISNVIPLLIAKGKFQEELFELAREVRHEVGGSKVILRGVIEISNVCKKACNYCAMRSTNKVLNRYLLEPEKIVSLAERIKEMGINVVFLQAGQTHTVDHIIEEVVPLIKNELGMEVLLCLGEKPKKIYNKFARLGVDSYILKYETSDPILYNRIAHSQLRKRLQCIEWIKQFGIKLGTGNIVGLPGQSIESLANDILLDIQIDPDFVSASPFIPNNNTPFQNHPKGDANLTLNTIAILRLILRTPLIPSVSALEILLPNGQTAGLNAGANVITINFTPRELRDLYNIYSSKRFIVSYDHAMYSIERAGLRT
ncbi:MAG: radical SAM protein [Candidatus Nitrosotenuis sp.]